ncbi:LexA family transcriptional regulator [Floricoccus penangensis]|uniref:LexA family transcriptional regulator n=1 Tax=Floricoccus penangensis TaxID=1859475 RepID=UPI00203B1780|nr:XRE family transcriptional regulator [Floricoccus penangensis]URZ86552.1 helix-turn-helix domain-containing protein [Floricoccus penangensis]
MARGELTPQDVKNRQIISDNINKLIDRGGLRQIDIHRATGIPKSTLTGYVKGTSSPTTSNMEKLAEYFNVDIGDIDPRFASGENFDTYEIKENKFKSILNDIQDISGKLTEDYQKRVLEYARDQFELQTAKNNNIRKLSFTNQASTSTETKNDKVVAFPSLTEVHAIAKSAAGFGYNYDENEFYTVYTDREDLPDFDFATYVSGDSMEPNYHDGDVVLVRQNYSAPDGGIYIVDYDGKSFIKQTFVDDDQLILSSLNKKYDDKILPIPPDEYTYWNIAGEVIDSFTPIEG